MGPGPQFTLLMFFIKTIIESEKDGLYDFFVESVDKENLFKYQSPISKKMCWQMASSS